jgi:hypothetical protein
MAIRLCYRSSILDCLYTQGSGYCVYGIEPLEKITDAYFGQYPSLYEIDTHTPTHTHTHTHTHHFLAFFNGIAIAEVTTAFPYQQPSDEKKIWCGFDFKNGAVLIPRGREIPWC